MSIEEISKCLWAKISFDGTSWLPLHIHMRDSADVSEYLWKNWLSESTRKLISTSMMLEYDDVKLLQFIRFLAASHDLGKASPAFQIKASSTNAKLLVDRVRECGLSINRKLDVNAIPHATISMIILEHEGLDRSVSVIVGGHHGMTPSKSDVRNRNLSAYASNTGFDDELWTDVQKCCFNEALCIAGIDSDVLCSIVLPSYVQDLLTGIVIMSDWIASNECIFPLISLDCFNVDDTSLRSMTGWSRLKFPHHKGLVYGKNKSFKEAFGFEPRCFQSVAMETVREMSEPGLIVIEAPMGEGKTELALAASELLASKFGQNGIFFGLPTQATANGVFFRVKSWVESCSGPGQRSLVLAHGNSAFNRDFESIPKVGWDVGNGRENIVVHEWFHGKTALLSDIVVGTVDQVLMAGLKRKHLSLRHLGLAEKVVIIDECHAYDEYMGSYLTKALSWLGAMKVPVIVMSATLPPKRKADMIAAYGSIEYREQSDAYPSITCMSGGKIVSASSKASKNGQRVDIIRIKMDEIIARIQDSTVNGGYVGVIVNTVSHAQQLYAELKATIPGAKVLLIHSAFTAVDRATKERAVMDAMMRDCNHDGKTTIIVGTQVLEQSLDIDFDVLFSEICPIDLLFQRIGRLHRHNNFRPDSFISPICYLIDTENADFDSGTEAVYGKLQLLNTRVLLGKYVDIPSDIPRLVSLAYSPSGVQVPDSIMDEYERARKETDFMMERKERKAKVFQIGSPEMTDLLGWLDNQRDDSNGLYAEATVRDTDGSVEIILVRRTIDGQFEIPVNPPVKVPFDSHIPSDVARQLATCRLKVPHRLLTLHGIEKITDTIVASNKDKVPKVWYDSGWISGEIIQIMESDGSFEILGLGMKYDYEMGLKLND